MSRRFDERCSLFFMEAVEMTRKSIFYDPRELRITLADNAVHLANEKGCVFIRVSRLRLAPILL
jgi:hypothetical protein